MDLSPAQRHTLDDMINAPMYDGSLQWCATRVSCDGLVNGNCNTNTLKAMERKGVIRIVELGNWWNDTIELLEN